MWGGYDKNTAKQTLVDLGVSVTTRRETNDSVAEGNGHPYRAGRRQARWRAAPLWFCMCAKPTRVTTASVPSVEGLDETAARNAINTANLVPAVREVNSDQPAGTVIEQNPSAGDTVSLYSVVVLYVSTGVPEVVATPAPAEPNGDPNTIIQEWYDEVPEGSGNWVRRYLTGDGVTHNDDGSVYTGMTGYIAKGVGGFYYVRTETGLQECRAPRDLPQAGHHAGGRGCCDPERPRANMIDEIAPRKNVFVRPPIANLDVLFIVASTTQPVPSTRILDELTAAAVYKDVQPVLVITKSDLAAADQLLAAYEKSGIPVILLHHATGEGLDALREWIQGRPVRFLRQFGGGQIDPSQRPGPGPAPPDRRHQPEAGPRAPYHPRGGDL